MENVLILGNGFIANHLPYQKYIRRIDPTNKFISDFNDILKYKPNVIINCIGKTGVPNIDWCENNKEETEKINTELPILLSNRCNMFGIKFIHISSGCVYYGKSPNMSNMIDLGWNEQDTTIPLSFYSKSKYKADMAIKDTKNTSILRIRMPISDMPSPRNLINKLLNYKKVLVEPNSVTFVSDLINVIDFFITKNLPGIYHITNPEPLTHDIILDEYKKYVPSHQYEKITPDELDAITVAKRSNCILNSNKLNKAGFHMTPSLDALKITMANYIKNKGIK